MPAYKFEALDAAGKASTGLLDAENAKAARSQLRARALVPMSVALVASAGELACPHREARGVEHTPREAQTFALRAGRGHQCRPAARTRAHGAQ